ncbi:MAG TPA: hypothetical protein VLJ21_03645 [Candidatus Binatia bacterium]|nr:hypothetical protein [Candidatus Binatia bacterium]
MSFDRIIHNTSVETKVEDILLEQKTRHTETRRQEAALARVPMPEKHKRAYTWMTLGAGLGFASLYRMANTTYTHENQMSADIFLSVLLAAPFFIGLYKRYFT